MEYAREKYGTAPNFLTVQHECFRNIFHKYGGKSVLTKTKTPIIHFLVAHIAFKTFRFRVNRDESFHTQMKNKLVTFYFVLICEMCISFYFPLCVFVWIEINLIDHLTFQYIVLWLHSDIGSFTSVRFPHVCAWWAKVYER